MSWVEKNRKINNLGGGGGQGGEGGGTIIRDSRESSLKKQLLSIMVIVIFCSILTSVIKFTLLTITSKVKISLDVCYNFFMIKVL